MKIAFLFIVQLYIISLFGQTRDPYLWPFATESIWNLPLHNDAWNEGNFEDANIDLIGLPNALKAEGVQIFVENESDPLQEYHQVKWSDRCTDHAHYKNYYVHFPDNYTWNGNENGQGNSAFALFRADRDTIWDGTLFTRCEEASWVGGAWFGPDKAYSISGPAAGKPLADQTILDSVEIWGHGASRISALGGLIRKGELTSPENEPIRHALKFTIQASKYLASCEIYGGRPYKWPAQGADGYACDDASVNKYLGDNADFVMGTLLALPQNLTKEDLGLTSLTARKIFDALQTYGAYIVEDAGRADRWQFLLEEEAITTDWPIGDHSIFQEGSLYEELTAIIGELHIIKKNDPDNIGGGPTLDFENRVAPVACELGIFRSGSMCDNQISSNLRDPYKRPFSKTSIWNMPVGSAAKYEYAGITPNQGKAVVAYHDVIIITPDEPLLDVYSFPGSWGSDRCLKGTYLGALPIPKDFYLPYTGKTVDHPAAILEQNHRTLNQSQPVHRCPENSFFTSKFWGYPDVDIYGEGIEGAHGGSGLSSIGGTIRIGEFTQGEIPHALKISMWAEKYYTYDKVNDPTPGYRWPAVKADGYAEGEYAGINPAFQIGSLLALKPDFDISLCKTEPGKILAQAFKNYGGYIVDDSKWDVFKIPIELGPEGNVEDEFKNLYGYSYDQDDKTHPWSKDLVTIFTNLYIIDNNSPDSIGGGGDPIVPPAPDFLPWYNLTIQTDGSEGVKINNPGTHIITYGKKTTLRILSVPLNYKFKNWEVIEGNALLLNSNQEVAQIILASGDAKVQANFEENNYTIEKITVGEGSISLLPEQVSYPGGSNVEVNAVPAEGWVFNYWNGDVLLTDNPFTFNITKDTTFTAHFSEDINPYVNDFKLRFNITAYLEGSDLRIQFTPSPQGDKCSVRIYSITGKLLMTHSQSLSLKNLNLSVDELGKGIYFVRIEVGHDFIDTLRFVKI